MPEKSDLETMSHAVEARVVRWLRRRGLLTRDGDEAEPSERSAIDACLEGSLGIGELVSLKLADSRTDDEPEHSARNLQQTRRAKSKRGFEFTPPSGLRRPTARGVSDCCATAPARH